MAKMYGPCSRKQQMILENDADFLIIGGAAGCLSKDHEVMTPNGVDQNFRMGWSRYPPV